MKAQPIRSIHRLWLAGWFAAAGIVAPLPCAAEPPTVRDVVTHEQLAQRLQQVQQEDPMKLMPAATGEDPAKNSPKDLLSQSDVLCFGGMATLVPKRAILVIPKALENRTKFVPGSKLMGWTEFCDQNRGWISTVEVTRTQAEGNEPLAADVTQRFKDSPNLVVATYLGGPISVLPLKAPLAEKPAATTASTATPKP